MTDTYVLRVFTDGQGNYGDGASVVVDEGKHLSDERRLALTKQLGTGETVFINNLVTADISVMHYQGEIDFAGTGVLAAAWLIHKVRKQQTFVLHGRKGAIGSWQDGTLTWVRTELSSMPPWQYKQVATAEIVEALTQTDTQTMAHTVVWAWLDEAKGLIRARTFASDWDIPEAEGNGSGAMLLAAKLNRALEIRHGQGSVMFARPEAHDRAAIGGNVVNEDV